MQEKLASWIMQGYTYGKENFMELQAGQRLKDLRESTGISQQKLCEVMGLEHRQTLGQIENGQRRVTINELIKALDFFEVEMDVFTNPFIPLGKQQFSWRRTLASPDDLYDFENRARQWIGAYHELGKALGDTSTALRYSLDIQPTSSFEDALAAGDTIAQQLGLGLQPAYKLVEAMQDQMGILVLMVDAIPGISGAASTLRDLNVALINRQEPAGRRNFDLAHELFHLLSWKAMPPSWIDGEGSRGDSAKQINRIKRVERLADNFAAGLLMPGYALAELGRPCGDLIAWINNHADQLGVSATALKWRLVNMGISPELADIADIEFHLGRQPRPSEFPALFSEPFARRIAAAIGKGLISVRKAAAVTNLTIEGLGDMFDAHNVARPSTMGGALEAYM